MLRNLSERLLGPQVQQQSNQEQPLNKNESTWSFHQPETKIDDKPLLIQKANQTTLCCIYVVCQIFQLMIGFSLVQNIDIITISAQRCIITVILTLLYIQFFDTKQYRFDQGYVKVFAAMSLAQVLASLMGLLAMQQFPFSEVCTFHQLTAGYVLVLQHILIQPGNQMHILISIIQTVSTVFFSGNFLYTIACLLQPLCLAFISTLRFLMTRQIQLFTLQLYINLLGLPIYIFLNIFSQNIQNMFDMTYFIEVLCMCVLQLLAYLCISELQNQQMPQMHIWGLSGIVTILSLVVQIGYDQTALGYSSLSVIFIVFTSIGMYKNN